MSDVYSKLARVLDELPNGFPATESGVEIKILKKIFTPEQAELYCDLTLKFETAEQIARPHRPASGGAGKEIDVDGPRRADHDGQVGPCPAVQDAALGIRHLRISIEPHG